MLDEKQSLKENSLPGGTGEALKGISWINANY